MTDRTTRWRQRRAKVGLTPWGKAIERGARGGLPVKWPPPPWPLTVAPLTAVGAIKSSASRYSGSTRAMTCSTGESANGCSEAIFCQPHDRYAPVAWTLSMRT